MYYATLMPKAQDVMKKSGQPGGISGAGRTNCQPSNFLAYFVRRCPDAQRRRVMGRLGDQGKHAFRFSGATAGGVIDIRRCG